MMKPPTRVQRRLIEAAAAAARREALLAFQHAVLCHVGLPYRDPGDDVREWQRANGAARLLMVAGSALHPVSGEWFHVGLPFGAKPRLILAYLNGEALRQGSPVVDVAGSLTAFVKRLGLASQGHNMVALNDQLVRLSASLVRFGWVRDGRAVTVKSAVVDAFDLWPPAPDSHTPGLWTSQVRLSAEYFASLQDHAVPLHEGSVAALSHSAVALDLYSWLASRLHRVPPGRPAVVSWDALRDQFGYDYSRLGNFMRDFRVALGQVLTQYPTADVELCDDGLLLRNSPTPVSRRLVTVTLPPAPVDQLQPPTIPK